MIRTLRRAQFGGVICLSVAFVLSACGDSKTCAQDSDCFSGEFCSDGICTVGQPSEMPSESVDVADARADFSATDDMALEDAEARPDTLIDSGSDGSQTLEACIVEPFDECIDDENLENNSYPGERISDRPRGCINGFVPIDTTIEGRMCQLESSDIYSLILHECETSFILEATLMPSPQCDPELINFDINGYAGTCESPGNLLECDVFEDGSQQIRLLVSDIPGGVAAGVYFYLQTDEDRNDIAFDYNLRIQVRQ